MHHVVVVCEGYNKAPFELYLGILGYTFGVQINPIPALTGMGVSETQDKLRENLQLKALNPKH